MRQRLLAFTVLSLALLFQSGCCWFHKFHCRNGCFPDKWCDSGCGETYWCEWDNDPPLCHDPCNRCGNYVGRGCGCGHCGGGSYAGPSPTEAPMYDESMDSMEMSSRSDSRVVEASHYEPQPQRRSRSDVEHGRNVRRNPRRY